MSQNKDSKNGADTTDNDIEITSKSLVRTLLILGIGIPVLIELTTVLGLFGSHFNGSENSSSTQEQQIEDHRRLTGGDSLYNGKDLVITLRDMHLLIFPTHWNFQISLLAENINTDESYRLLIHAVELENGNNVKRGKEVVWNENSPADLDLSWKLSGGDRPVSFQYSLVEGKEDSLISHRTVNLGHITAVYERK